MTSLETSHHAASPSKNSSSNMDPSALSLSKYLDLLPQPAMIFTYESNSEDLAVCYVNKSFLDSIGDSPLEEDSEALIIGHNEAPVTSRGNYMRILQTQCINPTAAQLTTWINGVTREPEKMHHLTTRFKGYSIPQDSISERTPKVVDIEWNAAVMEGRFIILTGRRTGTVKFSPVPPPPVESVIQRDFETSPTIVEETEEEGSQTSEEPQSYSEAITASSSSSNESNPLRGRRRKHRHSATLSSDRTRVRSQSENGNGLGTHINTWKLSEKFIRATAGGGENRKLLREKDWSKTPLGHIHSWNQTLLTMTSVLMASTYPMSLWWGREATLIYNDGYAALIGVNHPAAFGGRAENQWHEAWPDLKPLFDDVWKGESVYFEDYYLNLTRHGYTEEAYFTWSYIPIRDENGQVCGLLNPCYESTERILAERRLRTLRELDSQTAYMRTLADLGPTISKAFTFNPYDVPFALIYFCSTEFGTSSLYTGSTNQTSSAELARRTSLQGTRSGSAAGTERTDSSMWVYHLHGLVGIPEGHSLAPKSVEITVQHTDVGLDGTPAESELHFWPFRKMAEGKTVIGIPDLPPEILEGIHTQGWPELPKEAVAVPIMGARDFAGKDVMMGMLVLGINPRRAFDETYQTFANMCGRQIAAAITTVKNIQEEAMRAEELTALNRDRTSFFSGVSHELRTPLTLILGPLDECLEDPSLSQQHKGRLDLVRRNARRLLRLVNSILDFSKVEAGKMGAAFRETNLKQYTADLASLFRSAIEKGGVRFIVNTSGKERPVWVDRDMWEKIVFNLIGNAYKFTLTGQITVVCRLADDGRHMLFSVEDTGCGIPSHEVNRIFEKFHRVHDQKGRSFEGTGIGLALTQELVKLHGGKLELESTYGQGTTFIVQLPIGNTHLPKTQLVHSDHNDLGKFSSRAYGQSVVEEASHWATRNSKENTPDLAGGAMSTTSSDTNSTMALQTAQWVPISSRGCRILIADDSEDMRRYVKGVLLQFYDVIEAPNGQKALSIAVQETPDLIISDDSMPSLGGLGLLKVIRSSPETRSIPFILLSAKAEDEARVEGLLAGADDYLAKPFNARELIARVHTHLDIARMRVELEKRVKEKTKDLMESETRYRILTAISPVGIFRLDMEGTVTYANQKWREITSIEENHNDSAGESYLNSVHPDDREVITENWRRALKNTERCSFEVRWGSRDSFCWAMGDLVPEVINGEMLGFIGVLTDVTERREMEAEKLVIAEEVRAQQELAIGMPILSVTEVDVICHELRNPLNGIYHNADILVEMGSSIRDIIQKFRADLLIKHNTEELSSVKLGAEDTKPVTDLIEFLDVELEQGLESLESLNLCAKHQKRIADDVLQMSKLSMNLVSLTQTAFDPLVETSNVIRMFEREAYVKGIDFKFSLGTAYRDLDIGWVSADPIRFSQVLVNFISNAVRFTEKSATRDIEVSLDASKKEPSLPSSLTASIDGPTHTLQSGTSEEGNETVYLIASVADSGVGLSPEERSNLFRKFTQATPRTHIEYGGSGLGLFISKALVEVQGGRISLESEKNKGTTFTFYIRATLVEKPVHSPTSNKSRSVSPKILTPRIRRSPSSTSSISQAKRGNVLVVEDNLVLTRQLRLEGFDTTVAGNGIECLERVNEQNFDIILMDVEMPQMNGITAASEIRKQEAAGDLTGRTPIIAVTGNARKEYVDKASSVGIDSFIVKPYDKKELIDKIRSLVR